MDTMIQNIIIGVILIGAAAYLIYRGINRRRTKKVCSQCPVVKASRGEKLT